MQGLQLHILHACHLQNHRWVNYLFQHGPHVFLQDVRCLGFLLQRSTLLVGDRLGGVVRCFLVVLQRLEARLTRTSLDTKQLGEQTACVLAGITDRLSFLSQGTILVGHEADEGNLMLPRFNQLDDGLHVFFSLGNCTHGLDLAIEVHALEVIQLTFGESGLLDNALIQEQSQDLSTQGHFQLGLLALRGITLELITQRLHHGLTQRVDHGTAQCAYLAQLLVGCRGDRGILVLAQDLVDGGVVVQRLTTVVSHMGKRSSCDSRLYVLSHLPLLILQVLGVVVVVVIPCIGLVTGLSGPLEEVAFDGRHPGLGRTDERTRQPQLLFAQVFLLHVIQGVHFALAELGQEVFGGYQRTLGPCLGIAWLLREQTLEVVRLAVLHRFRGIFGDAGFLLRCQNSSLLCNWFDNIRYCIQCFKKCSTGVTELRTHDGVIANYVPRNLRKDLTISVTPFRERQRIPRKEILTFSRRINKIPVETG